MKKKYTPGPWFAAGYKSVWRVWHDEGIACVADVHPGLEPDPTAEANARLIACAPDLLAACEAALKGHGHVHEDSCSIGPDSKVCSCHVALLENAVAKARGG